jgi:hypothetical protein
LFADLLAKEQADKEAPETGRGAGAIVDGDEETIVISKKKPRKNAKKKDHELKSGQEKEFVVDDIVDEEELFDDDGDNEDPSRELATVSFKTITSYFYSRHFHIIVWVFVLIVEFFFGLNS